MAKASRPPGNLPLGYPIDTEDPRIEAFRRWLRGVDRLDRLATHRAVVQLRQFGVSVCVCSPPRGGGGQ